mmetsp:Transcript_47667/g.113531  ORF Transcript_47667/g.113531 Transcript_47667/m.113531 type:complete len:148 (-) Transcript_47667:720-1163(-)
MTMMVQLPCICCIRESKAACTMASFSASSAEVASSRRRMRGLRTKARAMLSRCFWPPLKSWPLSPTIVLYPSGSARMNSSAFASLAARSTSSMVYSVARRPYVMFSVTVIRKSCVSCDTTPTLLRYCRRCMRCSSVAFRKTAPPCGS